MAGLPGAYDRFDIPGLQVMLERYRDVTADVLKQNLVRFLREVIPTAEECGVRMCIHPDDPPRPLMGLPRVVSTADDIAFILGAVDSRANGLTLCSGSLGAHPNNDVPRSRKHSPTAIHFAHLRNVRKEPNGTFMEAAHLEGDTDMVKLVTVLLDRTEAGAKRKAAPTGAFRCAPITATNCSTMSARPTHPGYPAIGRLKGLAELRGVMTAVAQVRQFPL